MLSRAVLSENSRAALLTTCREITRVLGALESRSGTLGTTAQHAAMQAQLAVLLARLEAGDSSRGLVLAMKAFARQYQAYVELIAPR